MWLIQTLKSCKTDFWTACLNFKKIATNFKNNKKFIEFNETFETSNDAASLSCLQVYQAPKL